MPTVAPAVIADTEAIAAAAAVRAQPVLSVVVLNYNGAGWLDRCLNSLGQQTLTEQVEVIVADNHSPDQSHQIAASLMQGRSGWRVLQHGKNLGVSEGYNRAASSALGRYLLFLNADTWLEPDCLERLMEEVILSGAVAATPLVLDYLTDEIQCSGEAGFDVFGMLSGPARVSSHREIFVACGPALLVNAGWFRTVGGFDPKFFMYGEEFDLCWRLWLAGGKVILASSSRIHHRGAVSVNPCGGERVIEARTSDSKRFYANRNNLLAWLKNSQHLLLAFVPLQLLLLAAEAVAMTVLTRRWSHARRAYWDAVADCWRLRGHIMAARRRGKEFRRHGDFWMLRFLRWRLNRWRELKRFRKVGLPKVDAR